MPAIALDYPSMDGAQPEGEERGMPVLGVRGAEDGAKGAGLGVARAVPA